MDNIKRLPLHRTAAVQHRTGCCWLPPYAVKMVPSRFMHSLVFHFIYALSASAKKSLKVTPSAAQMRSIVGTPN